MSKALCDTEKWTNLTRAVALQARSRKPLPDALLEWQASDALLQWEFEQRVILSIEWEFAQQVILHRKKSTWDLTSINATLAVLEPPV